MSGETAAAAAGGVNVMLTPQTTARICLLQVRFLRLQDKLFGIWSHNLSLILMSHDLCFPFVHWGSEAAPQSYL